MIFSDRLVRLCIAIQALARCQCHTDWGTLDSATQPQSLHKYLYTPSDPVNHSDPTGLFFGLLLGAAFGSNLQSMSAQFYDAAYETTKAGLGVLDDYYNMKLLDAFAMDSATVHWASERLQVVAVLAMMRETIRVSEIVGMASDEWGRFVQAKFGYLPLTNRAGKAGEYLATAYLKKQGYTDVIAITNATGHGLDIIAKKDGAWNAFEVKAHILKGYGRLSPLQKKGPKAYANYVLKQIDQGKGHWKNVAPEVLLAADQLRDYLRKGGSLSETVIDVDFALNTAGAVLRRTIWGKVK